MKLKLVIPLTLIFVCSITEAENNCVEASSLFRKGVDLADSSESERNFYLEAAKLCPTMAEAFYNIGVIDSRNGKIDSALENYKKALELVRKPEFLSAIANISLTKKEFEQARKYYEEALELAPDSITALQGLSIVYDNLNLYDKAEEVLLKAAEIKSADAGIQYNLGVVLERQNRLQDAISAYENAVNADSKHFPSHFHLGLAYQRAGRYEDSRKVLEQAAALQSGNALVHRALAVSYEKLAQYERAELAIRRALKIDGNDVMSLVNLGIILMSKVSSNPLEAANVLEKALEIDPRNAKALTALGWANIELGRHTQAESVLRKALEIDASNSFAHNNLGVLYLRMGRNEEAERSFEKAIALNPNLSEARKNLRQFGR